MLDKIQRSRRSSVTRGAFAPPFKDKADRQANRRIVWSFRAVPYTPRPERFWMIRRKVSPSPIVLEMWVQ
ncbi:hypothetical protein [uncultured Tateyamaria sp.]|uniref:hypothetical protein n=1 Tax=uncultured Tateyamaria sp. TaxID=455651 RepID=UPI00261024D1|nr:hypothetical protein [uncultured Tateyamaria sp.]